MCNHDHIWFHLTQTLFLPHYSTNQAMHCLLQGLQKMPLPSHQEYIFEVHLSVSTPCACSMHVREQPQSQPAPFWGKCVFQESARANYRHHILHRTALTPTPPLPPQCAIHCWETLVLISTQKNVPAFILMMISICSVVMRAALVDVGSACLWLACLFSKMCFKHGLG